MAKQVHLIDWKPKGNMIKLIYPKRRSFYVSQEDFNRAFGPIVSGNMAEIKRDFKLSFWRRLCKKKR